MQPIRPSRRMRVPPRIALSIPHLPVWRSRLAPDAETRQIFLFGHQNCMSNKQSGVSPPAIRPAGRGNKCGKPAVSEGWCSLCHPLGFTRLFNLPGSGTHPAFAARTPPRKILSPVSVRVLPYLQPKHHLQPVSAWQRQSLRFVQD